MPGTIVFFYRGEPAKRADSLQQLLHDIVESQSAALSQHVQQHYDSAYT